MNVLILAPHPDDEVIGCGGLIAHHTLRHDRVYVAYVTSGEMTDPKALRESEAQSACKALGSRPLFLHYPDGRVAEHQSQLGGHIMRTCRALCINRICAPHQQEPHPDHVAVALAAQAAWAATGVECLLYEVWALLTAQWHYTLSLSHEAGHAKTLAAYAYGSTDVDVPSMARGLSGYRAGCSGYAFGSVEAFGTWTGEPRESRLLLRRAKTRPERSFQLGVQLPTNGL